SGHSSASDVHTIHSMLKFTDNFKTQANDYFAIHYIWNILGRTTQSQNHADGMSQGGRQRALPVVCEREQEFHLCLVEQLPRKYIANTFSSCALKVHADKGTNGVMASIPARGRCSAALAGPSLLFIIFLMWILCVDAQGQGRQGHVALCCQILSRLPPLQPPGLFIVKLGAHTHKLMQPGLKKEFEKLSFSLHCQASLMRKPLPSTRLTALLEIYLRYLAILAPPWLCVRLMLLAEGENGKPLTSELVLVEMLSIIVWNMLGILFIRMSCGSRES
ncbi:hypothetical protein IRJ41_025614, partial [Triplophysa rosa]